MSGKLTLWVEDIRKYLQSGLYRQFDVAGRLLYIGETENFLVRSIDHLPYTPWKDEIHTIELEPMSKAEAKELEPKIIAVELPLYNTTHHPENAAHIREQEKARSNREQSFEQLLYSRAQTAHALGGISIATVQRMEARGLLDKVRLAGSSNGAVFHRAEQVRKLAEGA
jgi:hypothetical protein